MSKPSHRPGREEIKERARKKKRRQRQLRRQQREAGLIPPAASSPANAKSHFQSTEEESAARQEAGLNFKRSPVSLRKMKAPSGSNFSFSCSSIAGSGLNLIYQKLK
ncbi:MAG: hypothetical protein P8Y25_09985, partial [Chromatiaceae bacterium]